jgi:hypothetical protein
LGSLKKDIWAKAERYAARSRKAERSRERKSFVEIATVERLATVERDTLDNWNAFSEIQLDDEPRRGHGQRELEVGDATAFRSRSMGMMIPAARVINRPKWREGLWLPLTAPVMQAGRRDSSHVVAWDIARFGSWYRWLKRHHEGTRYVGLKGHYEPRVEPEDPIETNEPAPLPERAKSDITRMSQAGAAQPSTYVNGTPFMGGASTSRRRRKVLVEVSERNANG